MSYFIKSILDLLPAVLSWPVPTSSLIPWVLKVQMLSWGVQRAPTQSPRCCFLLGHMSPVCSWPEPLGEGSHSAPWPGSSERTTTQSSVWKRVIRTGPTAREMQCDVLNYFGNRGSVFKMKAKVIAHNVSYFSFKRSLSL